MSVIQDTQLVLMRRQCHEVNNDPQRRCYWGCHFSTELVWGPWEPLHYFPPVVHDDEVRRITAYWKDLNDYAVAARGEGARKQFKVQPYSEVSHLV